MLRFFMKPLTRANQKLSTRTSMGTTLTVQHSMIHSRQLSAHIIVTIISVETSRRSTTSGRMLTRLQSKVQTTISLVVSTSDSSQWVLATMECSQTEVAYRRVAPIALRSRLALMRSRSLLMQPPSMNCPGYAPRAAGTPVVAVDRLCRRWNWNLLFYPIGSRSWTPRGRASLPKLRTMRLL
ncbi:hypothetical protein CB0940_06666 [Cercospora beticola]|uniref:Uncharacterized protein n=1 Tax=Cercospora beticola TaxID=122368 RepID=A0A2G5I1I5_CERBT|nr:hypothetical protein CB0940_06666 [Cercospora beticola]PIA98382.1 hypothetical protein CB0940_06666 [Cercospora beticola]